MSYKQHFQLADDIIIHLDSVIGQVNDPFITSRYVGFLSVAAVTVYELAIKEIFISFCEKKHHVFGHFAKMYFERLNGRIKYKLLHKEHIPRFGEKYVKKFKDLAGKKEDFFLKSQKFSIKSSYNNVIEWRHQFAHQGIVPSTVTYNEVKQSYEAGKNIIICLDECMRR